MYEWRSDVLLFLPLFEMAIFGILIGGAMLATAARRNWASTQTLALSAADHEFEMRQLLKQAPREPTPVLRAARIATRARPSGSVIWTMRKDAHFYEAIVMPARHGYVLRFLLNGGLQSQHRFNDDEGVKLGELATATRDDLIAHGWQDFVVVGGIQHA